MSKRAEDAAIKTYPEQTKEHGVARFFFSDGYEQAEKDIIALIESRVGEIIGDAQPRPVLRAELTGLISKIKEDDRERQSEEHDA